MPDRYEKSTRNIKSNKSNQKNTSWEDNPTIQKGFRGHREAYGCPTCGSQQQWDKDFKNQARMNRSESASRASEWRDTRNLEESDNPNYSSWRQTHPQQGWGRNFELDEEDEELQGRSEYHDDDDYEEGHMRAQGRPSEEEYDDEDEDEEDEDEDEDEEDEDDEDDYDDDDDDEDDEDDEDEDEDSDYDDEEEDSSEQGSSRLRKYSR